MARTALCIGINYLGTDGELGGCHNDANDWHGVLSQRGFAARMLIEQQATRAAILHGIDEALRAATGDTCVVTYSGHGSYMADDDGDEPDGRDEIWCPVDYRDEAYVTDDDLYALLNRYPRTTAVVITDSCFNGTIARSALRRPGTMRPRFLSPSQVFRPEVALAAFESRANPGAVERPDRALVVTGVRDDEYAWDATFDGRPNGAFTYHALRALERLSADADYRDWLHEIWNALPSHDFPQAPTLVGTFDQQHRPVFT